MPLDLTNCLRLARPAVILSTKLRHGGAPWEALRLAERLNRWLRDRAPQAPEAHYFVELSQSWQQIGKARWELGQAEETVDAYRHALAAQLRAYQLAPAVTEYRQELGRRYMQLGRKLCELGHLGEAEFCFREREVLWPGDAGKREEALRELRKWADQVRKSTRMFSAKGPLECQRYLDLCLRLERRPGFLVERPKQ